MGEPPSFNQLVATSLIVFGEIVVAILGDHTKDEGVTMNDLTHIYLNLRLQQIWWESQSLDVICRLLCELCTFQFKPAICVGSGRWWVHHRDPNLVEGWTAKSQGHRRRSLVLSRRPHVGRVAAAAFGGLLYILTPHGLYETLRLVVFLDDLRRRACSIST